MLADCQVLRDRWILRNCQLPARLVLRYFQRDSLDLRDRSQFYDYKELVNPCPERYVALQYCVTGGRRCDRWVFRTS